MYLFIFWVERGLNLLYSNVCICLCGRVFDNLKDYLVKVLVNVVDYLGIVVYKLNDFIFM